MKVSSGTFASKPDLGDQEVYICSDRDEVYIGTAGGSIKFVSTNDKEYIAIASEASEETGACILTEIKNDSGLTVTMAKSDVGIYAITCTDVTASNCFIAVTPNTTDVILATATPGAGTIAVKTYDVTDSGTGKDFTSLLIYIKIVG